MNIAAVRAQLPALKSYTWFQNGGVSITPQPIADVHAGLMRELLERGPMHIVYPDEEYPRRRTTTARLARFFGVDAGEIAVVRGVSEGYQTLLRGMQWNEGDEVLITEEEEGSVLIPSLHLRERHGVKVVKLPLLDDHERLMAAFRERLSERTRLIAMSMVTTDIGFLLPVKEMCAIARDRNIATFFDLAHAAGLLPIDLKDLGLDYAGILSYKWMYSPYAAGLLYVRRERLHDLQVTYAGGRGEKFIDFEKDEFELHDTAERFQHGPWSWPLVHTWAFACDWLESFGLAEIRARTLELTGRLKAGLEKIPGITQYSSPTAERSAALVAVSLDRWTGEQMTAVLREENRMIVKPQPAPKIGLRISLPFFIEETEIDALLAAVAELADRKPPTQESA